MSLTPEQEALLRECSKDEHSYRRLLELFETRNSQQTSELWLLRAVLDSIPDRIYVKDRQSRFVLANRATWSAHDMPDEQSLLGKTDFDLFGKGGEVYYTDEQRMFETGAEIINVELNPPKVNSTRERPSYTQITKVPLRDDQSQVIGLIGVNRDITDLKRVEEELLRNQQFSVQITLAIPDIIYVYDFDEDAVIYCNDQVTAMLGYTPEQLYAMSSKLLPNLMHQEDLLRHRNLESRYLQAQDSDVIEIEHRMQHADGTWRWLLRREMIFKRKPDGTPAQLLGIANDITQRKCAEDALRQSEAQKNALINAIPDMMLEVNADGDILNYKGRSGLITRLHPHEYTGKNLLDIYPADFVEPLLILVRRALTTRQPQILEYESPLTKENALREARIIAIDETRALVISRDVTEHRTMQQALLERERLEIALQKEQELNLLKSRMMTRISHEFRTPLSVIMASNELLWHYNAHMSPSQRDEHYQRIQDEVQHMSEILKSISFILQTQLHQRPLEMKSCDLRQTCDQTIQQLQAQTEIRQHLNVVTKGDLRLLPADEHLIHRMMAHLLSNALKFSPPESEICVELVRTNKEIMLRFTDQGIGIPESDQVRLYEPFFRASNVGETGGMGLGLTLVKHVVDLHDGRIAIDSAVERGTTVTIHLPTIAG